MNLEFTIRLNGEEISPNNELLSTITEILTSYIKQSLGGKAIGIKKVHKWSDEDRKLMVEKVETLLATGMKPSQVWKEVAKQFNHTTVSVYQQYNRIKKGN